MGRLDLLDVHGVLPGTIRGKLGIPGDGSMAMEGCRGDLQNTADRPSPSGSDRRQRRSDRWRDDGDRRDGSAPKTPRCSSMKMIICGTGGRAPQASLAAMPRCLRSWAKYAFASGLEPSPIGLEPVAPRWATAFAGSPVFRISLSVRSSRVSRASSFSRARSTVVRPARSPASRAACRHRVRRVSWEQPSFEATAR